MIRRSLILLAMVLLTTSAMGRPGSGGGPGRSSGGGSGGGPGRGSQKSQTTEPAAESAPPASQPSPSSTDNPALRKAQADLATARAAAKTKYEANSAWTDAAAAVKSAQADSDSTVKPVLEALKSDAKYKAAAAELATTETKMSTLRQSDEPDPAAMSAAASAAMSDRAALRTLEKSAVSNDPAANAAAQRLTEAQTTMTKLRGEEESTIAADPDVIVAKQAVDDAKANH